MIKTIIFDLGSVCFHINWLEINKEMVDKFGITTLIRSCGNKKAEQYYDEFQEGKGKMEKVFAELNPECKNVNEAIEFYKNLYRKYKKTNEKIFDLIKKLKGHYKLICLTDTNQVHFDVYNEDKNLDIFDKVFTSFQLGMKKSNPQTFVKILSELKINPKELIFVDDNQKNIENAKLAGINTIKFESNEKLIEDLRKSGVVI